MKKLFFVPLALLSWASFAQTTSIQLKDYDADVIVANNATLTVNTFPTTNVKITFDVKNTGPTTQTYTAKRYDRILNNTPADTAVAYFCFGGLCFGSSVIVSESNLVLTPNQKASEVPGQWQMLVADLDECSDIGYSLVKYTFANINVASDSVQVTIQYNSPSVGLKENAKSNLKVSVFPNPSANGIVTVKGDAEFTKVEVINQLGSVIVSKAAGNTNGVTSLDLSDVAPGVYFIKVFAGEKSHTEKLVITK
jgi:hypothetical protein